MDLLQLPSPKERKKFRVKVLSVERHTSKHTGHEYLHLKLQVVGTRYYVLDNISLNPVALFKLEQACKALRISSWNTNNVVRDMVGKSCYVDVKWDNPGNLSFDPRWSVQTYSKYRRQPHDNREAFI